jgi:hypothetical protein
MFHLSAITDFACQISLGILSTRQGLTLGFSLKARLSAHPQHGEMFPVGKQPF